VKLFLFSLIFIIVTFFACSTTADKADIVATPFAPDTLNRLDSLAIAYGEAEALMQARDTAAAEWYYLQGINLLMRLTPEEKKILQEDSSAWRTLENLNAQFSSIFDSPSGFSENTSVFADIAIVEDSLHLSDNDSLAVLVDSSSAFPLVVNKRVAAAMSYFQGKGRPVFERWLERSGRYRSMYEEVLISEDVPRELFYLAMIESGFVNYARSYARATGPWQFMAGTGRMYGLRQNWWFDERRDPVKATRAAAQHLRWLYEYFDGDWLLAMAGYNMNPARVKKRMRIQNTRDFWQLRQIPRQTMNYVPTFMAAAILASNPHKYGFNPTYQKAIEIDTVHVHEAIDLALIAEWTDTTLAAIKEMNPAVIRWCTPPGINDFSVNIPPGTKSAFRRGLANIPAEEKISYIRYRIRSGDALSKIAERFHVSVNVIKKQNKLRSSRIIAGHYLIIPVPRDRENYYASLQKQGYSKKRSSVVRKARPPENLASREKVIYTVKSGDTVGHIAEAYGVLARDIRRWNGISNLIRPGQKITVYRPLDKPAIAQSVPTATGGEQIYTVKRGDTLWDIAERYQTSVAALKRRNAIGNTIKPGDQLIIP
jgi:membrane-bound lytic murein transglycosylase D